ncbi:MAG: phosphotransferase family protein [Deltaproteobacteria bacterium]|jgi:aminoglycoside phosphotransferase (APT) family kinase protein
MTVLDEATVIRNGETLDRVRVEAFLKEAVAGLTGDLTIRQFPSGYSNLTYLLTIDDREFVLRRPPFGTKAKTAHDMAREYKILKALHPVFPYCPEPLAYSEDPDVMDCPFYIMDRLHGIILRKDLPPGLSFTPEEAKQLCENLLDLHVKLHSIPYKEIGLDNFGKPEGYVQRQAEGWCKRYRAARTDDAPDFEDVMAWIQAHMPGETDTPTIIHNDYKLDNCVLDPNNPSRIIGILDWEMATIGDPLMDLGNSLAYWVQDDDPPEVQAIRTMPTQMAGALTREALIRRYAEKIGRPVSHLDFYLCFGLFRLAVIAQQIYYRYYHGQTKDERFKTLVFAVHVLEKTARRLILP